MVTRKITVKIYVLAFIFTLAIFLLGIYVGQIVNNQASSDLLTQINHYSQSSDSSDVMFLLGNSSSSFCPLYKQESSNIEDRTIEIGNKLNYLEKVKGVYDDKLKSQYFILELKSYLLADKINSLCVRNKHLILYFYSKNCPECDIQGKELDKLVSKVGSDKIRIYSFDVSITDSSVVNSLVDKYNISKYPAIMSNEKIYYNVSNLVY